MLSRAQQILLKRAQAQAGMGDEEYREHLERLVGVRSSTDPKMSDEHLDMMMSFFEGIYWRTHKAGFLPAPKPGDPFRQPGYWAAKNTATATSRDRFTGDQLDREIGAAEGKLAELGYGLKYLRQIKLRVTRGIERWTPPQQRAYLAALNRTIAAKNRALTQSTYVEN